MVLYSSSIRVFYSAVLIGFLFNIHNVTASEELTSDKIIATKQDKNISQGNFLIGGSFTFSNSYYDDEDYQYSSTTIGLPIEYFVIDNISLGGYFRYSNAGFSDESTSSTLSIGPSATLHLNIADRISAPITAYFLMNSNSAARFEENKETKSIGGDIGLRYFFTEAVSAGPSIELDRKMSAKVNSTSVSLLGQFNIYL